MKPKDLHTLLAFLGWGLTIDINLILKRYCTSLLSNQLIHNVLGVISAILSLSAYLVLAVDKIKFISPKNSYKTLHYSFGFGLVLLSFLALWLGYKASKNLLIKQNSRFRSWKIYMRKVGWMLYFGVKVEMLVGFTFHLPDLFYLYLFYLIILAGTLFSLEFNKKRKVVKFPSFESHTQQNVSSICESLVQDINENIKISDLEQKYKNLKWGLIGNQIYDLSHYNHPGGNYIFKLVQGKELSRYMYGGHPLETENVFHNHSFEAFKSIEKFCIGSYQRTENFFKFYSSDAIKFGNEMHQPFLMNKTFIHESDSHKVWHLASRELEMGTADIYRYDFTTDDFQIKFHPANYFSFGRYILLVIKEEENPILRPYTISSSLSSENKIIRSVLVENFENLINKREMVKHIDKELISQKNTLSLFIKNYRHSTEMTYRLHNTISKKTKFSVIGPIGRGLELDPKTSGKICILFIGTGILPFLDFLNFLLYKEIHTYVQQNYDEEIARQFELPLNYELFGKLDITMIGSFGDNPIGLDILQSLSRISRITKSMKFECHIKADSNNSSTEVNYFRSRIDEQFLKRLYLGDYSRFYICGTSNFNCDVQKVLSKLNIANERIVLL